MAINQLSPDMQSTLLNALCVSLGGFEPSESFVKKFPSFKVSELSEYFDVSQYLA